MFALGLRAISRTFSTSAVAEFPKLKTHSGAKKRWKAIASGAFKRVRSKTTSILSALCLRRCGFLKAHAGHSHLNVGKRPDRKNRLSQLAYSSPTQTAILKKAMPYS